MPTTIQIVIDMCFKIFVRQKKITLYLVTQKKTLKKMRVSFLSNPFLAH